ncbi:hypothetical protein PCE1_000588 [Barthelona sp. PCE]
MEPTIEFITTVENNPIFVQPGQTAIVHYRGYFPDTGVEFDSSIKRGTPFEFVLGAGRVIKGWDFVVAEKLPIGSKAKVTLPPTWAYGSRGAGNVIPPNATLAFDMEVLGAR